MTTFTEQESGMFSGANYVASAKTLTVVFRTTGAAYSVPNVSQEEADQFMTATGKSAIWHQSLKAKGATRVSG